MKTDICAVSELMAEKFLSYVRAGIMLIVAWRARLAADVLLCSCICSQA